jgi:DNA-binding YbaB/EbfC family protein
MPEGFPNETMTDFFKILQQAQQMQGKLQQMQEELQHRVVNGSAGGGLVSVEADGRGQIKKVKIDPSLTGKTDTEMLEDLIVVAVNDAQKKATELAQEEMGKLTGGMNLPFNLQL